MTKSKSKVSIVVCARNEEDLIEFCLLCLKKQTVKCEIIVVDGHSTDKTVEISKKYADKVVYDNQKGVSDARNIGWITASGDIVAYCDADARPLPDWIEKIIEVFKDKKVIGVSGPVFPYDDSGLAYTNLKIWTDGFFGLTAKLNFPFICGPNMAFRKTVLTKNPFMSKHIEEVELNERLRKVGKVKFRNDIQMPISARRYKTSFYQMAIKHYIKNYLKIKMGQKLGDDMGYFESKGKSF